MKKYSSSLKYLTFLRNVISNKLSTTKGLRQIKYLKDGKFSYEEYKKIQTEGNKEKIDEVFEIEENIKMLSNYLKTNLNDIKFMKTYKYVK